MIKKCIKQSCALIIGILMAVSAVTTHAQEIQKAPMSNNVNMESDYVTKTAHFNNAKVVVEGKTYTLPAYNIDGYNYFRVADICRALNMKVFPYFEGVKIIDYSPYDGTTVEAPPVGDTQKVSVRNSRIFYDSFTVIGSSFNLADRNYFKLADIVEASKGSYELEVGAVHRQADNAQFKLNLDRPTIVTLETEWKDNTIYINKQFTDLQKMYEQLKGDTPKKIESPAQAMKNEYLNNREKYELEVIDYVNEERIKAGLNGVVINNELMKVARWHTDEMADLDYFSHKSPTLNLEHFELAQHFGYTGTSAGENSYMGTYLSPKSVVDAWMRSTQGHREHIINPQLKEIGVGFVYTDDSSSKFYCSLFMGY